MVAVSRLARVALLKSIRDYESMPAQSDVGIRFASAVATPGRLRLMAALGHGPRTGASLAASLRTDVQAVARHALPLERLGLVTRTVGSARERVYTLAREPFFSDDVWGQLPVPVRRTTAAAILTQMQATAAAAVDEGGFDRRDMHLTRSALELDEDGWRRASELLLATYHRLNRIAQECQGPRCLRATAVMMLFGTPGAQDAAADRHPAPAFSEDEALRRTTDLVEELHEMVTAADTSWSAIVSTIDQLRVVARAGAAQRAGAATSAPSDR